LSARAQKFIDVKLGESKSVSQVLMPQPEVVPVIKTSSVPEIFKASNREVTNSTLYEEPAYGTQVQVASILNSEGSSSIRSIKEGAGTSFLSS